MKHLLKDYGEPSYSIQPVYERLNQDRNSGSIITDVTLKKINSHQNLDARKQLEPNKQELEEEDNYFGDLDQDMDAIDKLMAECGINMN